MMPTARCLRRATGLMPSRRVLTWRIMSILTGVIPVRAIATMGLTVCATSERLAQLHQTARTVAALVTARATDAAAGGDVCPLTKRRRFDGGDLLGNPPPLLYIWGNKRLGILGKPSNSFSYVSPRLTGTALPIAVFTVSGQFFFGDDACIVYLQKSKAVSCQMYLLV